MKWLSTIPGVGTYSAMIILSEIREIQRFPAAKSLFSYAGLACWVHESAGHQNRGGISRCGRPLALGPGGCRAHGFRGTTLFRSSATAQASPRGSRGPGAKTVGGDLRHVAAMLRDGECFDETIFAAV